MVLRSAGVAGLWPSQKSCCLGPIETPWRLDSSPRARAGVFAKAKPGRMRIASVTERTHRGLRATPRPPGDVLRGPLKSRPNPNPEIALALRGAFWRGSRRGRHHTHPAQASGRHSCLPTAAGLHHSAHRATQLRGSLTRHSQPCRCPARPSSRPRAPARPRRPRPRAWRGTTRT